MKCDLHVHSYYSGACTTPFVKMFCRESYNDPQQVYDLLARRGMNLFTLTDHDSIEGAERLRANPNFFVSEELTCRMPSGNEVHIGVYDITERQHIQLQQRRNDLVSLLMYLTERRLFFSVNHMFSGAHRAPANAKTSPGSSSISRRWKRATATCSSVPISRPATSPAAGTRSKSAAATPTRFPAPAPPTPKFPARATKTNSSPAYAPARAASRRIWQLHQAHPRRFYVAYEMMREKTWTRCSRRSPPHSCGHLLEVPRRASVQQNMGSKDSR